MSAAISSAGAGDARSGSGVAYPRDATIHALFRQQAARSGEAAALVSAAATQTYTELDRRSDHLARYLQECGVRPGSFVAALLPRAPSAIVAFLGILKAGAAFVPLDPGYPGDLLNFIVADSSPSVVLADASLLRAFGPAPPWSARTLLIEDALAAAAGTAGPPPEPAVGAEDVAYMMYTSGSTGRPKGVLTPHRGVVRLVINNDFARFGANEVFLQLAPLAFDAATLEIWGSLLNGGQLAFIVNARPTLDEIAAAIERFGVTTMWMTAGLFHLMVDHRPQALRLLRQLLAGGDVLSPDHVRRALAAAPATRLINGYGPTENTTFTCCYTIPQDFPPGASVPIGAPIARTECHVLDETLRPVPAGEEGQLCVGGDGLARGYWNRPELTAEKFIPSPFGQNGDERLYLTGDLVRRLPDGNFEFRGRLDRQVKINGKRIELGEIETILRQMPSVRDAVVVVRDEPPGAKRLCAYITPPLHDAHDYARLKAKLAAVLPDYMVPWTIVGMAALPLTPNGKVDRAALPTPQAMPTIIAGFERAARDTPDATQLAAAPSGDMPRNAMERELLAIWQAVLSTATIGTRDNFFDLGGTSLQLLAIHAELRTRLRLDLDVVALFQCPTIADLAAHLSRDAAAEQRMAGALGRAARQAEMLRRMRGIRSGSSM